MEVTERVRKVVHGESKRKTGFTIDEVFCLFKEGYPGKNSTETFESVINEDGSRAITHYEWSFNTIMTRAGSFIKNNQDYGGGAFGFVPYPYINCPSLPLTSLDRRYDIFDINVIDFSNGYTLFTLHDLQTLEDGFFLHGFDEGQEFCVEVLPRGTSPTTTQEALELLKPDEVLEAEASGMSVKRQGDLFLIPSANFIPVNDIQVTEREDVPIYDWFTESTSYKTKMVYPEILLKQEVSVGYQDKTDIVPIHTRHRSPRVTYWEGQPYVKLSVRHPEHSMIRLGDVWHKVVPNRVGEITPIERTLGD